MVNKIIWLLQEKVSQTEDFIKSYVETKFSACSFYIMLFESDDRVF